MGAGFLFFSHLKALSVLLMGGFLLMSAGLAGLVSEAQAAGAKTHARSWTWVGAPVYSNPLAGNVGETVYTPHAGWMAGVLFSHRLFSLPLEFETGPVFLQRSFDVTSGGFTQVASQNVILVPAILRLWLFRYFSLGGGGYASKGVGPMRFELSGVSQNVSYLDAGLRSDDVGVMTTAGVLLPFSDFMAFQVEGRMGFSLTNVASDDLRGAGGRIRNRDLGLVIGLRIGGGK